MNQMEIYKKAFAEAFEIEMEEAESFVYKETEKWDSIGHMMLISALEEAFLVEFEPEEMLELDSYQKGIDILRTKGIAL